MKSNEYLFKLNSLSSDAPKSLRDSYEFLYARAKSKESNRPSESKNTNFINIVDPDEEAYDVLSLVLQQYYSNDKMKLLGGMDSSVGGDSYKKYCAFIGSDLIGTDQKDVKRTIARLLIDNNASKHRNYLDKKISVLCLHKKDALNPYYSQFTLLADIGVRVYFEHKLDKAADHVSAELKKGFLPIVFLHQVEPFFDGPRLNSEKNIKALEDIASIAKLVFVWHNETPHSRNLLNKVYPYHIYLSELADICVTHSSLASANVLRYSRNRMLYIQHPALFPLEKYIFPSVAHIDATGEIGLITKKYFMTMGGVGYKNTLSVVIAWQSLSKDIKRDYKLLIVGKDFTLSKLADLSFNGAKININDDSICVVSDRISDDRLYSLMRDAYMGVCAYSSIWSSGVLCSFKSLLTPAIYNIDSGLSDYCLDGVDGIACDPSPSSIFAAFAKGLALSSINYQSMQIYCHFWKLDNTFFGFFSKVLASVFDRRNYEIQVNDLC